MSWMEAKQTMVREVEATLLPVKPEAGAAAHTAGVLVGSVCDLTRILADNLLTGPSRR